MKRSKFTEEQILFALKQADAGQPVGDVCRQMGVSKAAFYVWKKRYGNLGLLEVRELAVARPRFGYERLLIRLTREGWMVGRNKAHRLYKLDGLLVRTRARRKKRISLHRGPAPTALAAGQYWEMDFVHDQLVIRRKYRVLTIIDTWHRKCVALQVGLSLTGQSVVDALNEVALDEWCSLRGVKLDFIRPGKPTENGMIESFNGRLRDARLSVNELVTLDDVKNVLEAWRHDENHCRPHESLGNLTPSEYGRKWSGNDREAPNSSFE